MEKGVARLFFGHAADLSEQSTPPAAQLAAPVIHATPAALATHAEHVPQEQMQRFERLLDRFSEQLKHIERVVQQVMRRDVSDTPWLSTEWIKDDEEFLSSLSSKPVTSEE